MSSLPRRDAVGIAVTVELALGALQILVLWSDDAGKSMSSGAYRRPYKIAALALRHVVRDCYSLRMALLVARAEIE